MTSPLAIANWPAIVAAVRTCTGTRFRAQGRVPGLALDCVGVVLVAARAAGMDDVQVPAYALGGDHGDVGRFLLANGCKSVAQALPGDVLVLAPGGWQRHFGVVTPAGIVHAHAGLGRIVEGPIDSGWAVVGAARFPGAR